MNNESIFDVPMMREQHCIMQNAIGVSYYVKRRFARELFTFDDPEGVFWIDDVARNTGIDAAHLRNVFFSGEPLTLEDYLILSDHLGIDPLNDAEANKYVI